MFFFQKKQAQSERLSPTKQALLQAILRANYTKPWCGIKTLLPNHSFPLQKSLVGLGSMITGYLWWQPHLLPQKLLYNWPNAVVQRAVAPQTDAFNCRSKAQLNCADLCSCSEDDQYDNWTRLKRTVWKMTKQVRVRAIAKIDERTIRVILVNIASRVYDKIYRDCEDFRPEHISTLLCEINEKLLTSHIQIGAWFPCCAYFPST